WACRMEINEAADIILVLLPNLFAGGVIAIRILIILSNEIGRDPAIIVDVGLAVGHANGMPEFIELRLTLGGDQRFQVAGKKFVSRRVIFWRRNIGQPIGRVLRITEPEIVGLDRMIC